MSDLTGKIEEGAYWTYRLDMEEYGVAPIIALISMIFCFEYVG